MKHDPYLIPGQPCWLWNDINKFLIVGLFWKYDRQGTPMFVESYRNGKLDERNIFQTYKHYRPIGTEWDFIKNHPEQEKFICSTVDADGQLTLWNTKEIYPYDKSKSSHNTEVWIAYAHLGADFIAFDCGYCPDESRYKNGAWKTSLRMCPVWAGGKG